MAIDQNTNINQTYAADTLTLSGALSVAAGKTLTKNGGGVVTISGAQSHGAGSTLAITGGTVNLNSNAGTNLGISVAASTVLNTNATQTLGTIANAGQTNVVSGTATVASITGTGSTAVTGATAVLNAASLAQSTLSVSTGAIANVGAISLSGAVANAGTFNSSGGGTVSSITGTGTTNVTAGSLTAPTITQGNLNVAVGANLTATTLTISGTSSILGTLNASGGGTVPGITGTGTTNLTGGTTNSTLAVRQDEVGISNGAVLNVADNGGATGVSLIKELNVEPTSTFNIKDNDLVIDYGAGESPYQTILNLVKSGLTAFGGTGVGITSTQANSVAGTTLAVVDGLATATSTSGFAIPNPTTSVVVKYTWIGDSNVDGVVDGTDYALTDSGFAGGGGTWNIGDYNYSGGIDGTDYALIDTGFGSQSGTLPEPTTLGLLGLGALGMLRRRRNPARVR